MESRSDDIGWNDNFEMLIDLTADRSKRRAWVVVIICRELSWRGLECEGAEGACQF